MNRFIEFTSVDDCNQCDKALHELVPLAKKEEIDIVIKPPVQEEYVPVTCVVDGDEKNCTYGYGESYMSDVENLLNKNFK